MALTSAAGAHSEARGRVVRADAGILPARMGGGRRQALADRCRLPRRPTVDSAYGGDLREQVTPVAQPPASGHECHDGDQS
ncbi:hypothetical protein [Tahibacter sp.]|uniref:hypothetical protein n=1 Tax=Tahibacter sp. TaxID=2056211 RepID=UPI002D7EA76B|nr:hypothetical protein [Tahibacter sp.]